MQYFSDSVIEASDADVIGDPDSRFLQCLVNAGSSLIGTNKKSSRPLATGEQGLDCQVTEFTVFRTDLAKTRFEISFPSLLAGNRGRSAQTMASAGCRYTRYSGGPEKSDNG